MRPEPVVEADAARDLDDVGADELAHVRDLVDEADARREEGVGRELDELGRGDVDAEELGLDPLVQLDHAFRVGRLEGADDDAVGAHEVGDCGSLGGELRVRDVADVLEAARIEPRANVLARPDRDGALHHEERPARYVLRDFVHDRPHRGEVGVAGVRRRRPDGDVEEVGAGDRLANVERERDPVATPLEHLVEPGLVDRHLTGLQPLDALGQDVADDDLVAEIREARAGDETDVAGPEDPDPRHGPRVLRWSAAQRREALRNGEHRRVRELVEDRVHVYSKNFRWW